MERVTVQSHAQRYVLSPLQSGKWAKLFPRQMTASKPPAGGWGTSLSRVIQLASSMTGDQEREEGSGWNHGTGSTHLHQGQPCLGFPLKTHTGTPHPVRGKGITMDMEGEKERGSREKEVRVGKEGSALTGFYLRVRTRQYKHN